MIGLKDKQINRIAQLANLIQGCNSIITEARAHANFHNAEMMSFCPWGIGDEVNTYQLVKNWTGDVPIDSMNLDKVMTVVGVTISITDENVIDGWAITLAGTGGQLPDPIRIGFKQPELLPIKKKAQGKVEVVGG